MLDGLHFAPATCQAGAAGSIGDIRRTGRDFLPRVRVPKDSPRARRGGQKTNSGVGPGMQANAAKETARHCQCLAQTLAHFAFPPASNPPAFNPPASKAARRASISLMCFCISGKVP